MRRVIIGVWSGLGAQIWMRSMGEIPFPRRSI